MVNVRIVVVVLGFGLNLCTLRSALWSEIINCQAGRTERFLSN